MDIICASICYRGYAEDEVAATLAQAPKIGYRSMEIHGPALWSVEAVAHFDVQAMAGKIAAAGMRCAGLYPPGWGGKDRADVAAHARAIAQCVRFAEILGAHHIATTGASRREEAGALGRVIDCVRQVLQDVRVDTPVKLTLEPHYGNVLQQPEDFEEVLAATADPRMGICVDTGHFHAAGVDTVAFIRRYGGRIHSVHLKDHIGRTSVGIGRGEINLSAIVAALREVNYTGGLTVELEVEDPQNLPVYTKEAFAYIRGLLGQDNDSGSTVQRFRGSAVGRG